MLAVIKIAADLALAFAGSRIGQIVIAFVVAWLWSGARTDDHWRGVIATEKASVEAAYRAEVARQEQAAREIAAAATARAEEDAALEAALRQEIEAFAAREKTDAPTITQKAASVRCAVDDHFAGLVRQFDRAAHRKARPSRATR